MYCSKKVFTYGSKFSDGYVSKGGYAEFHRVHERFCFAIPENLSSAHAAPLLCAGMTVYSPLKHFGVGPGYASFRQFAHKNTELESELSVLEGLDT